MKKSKIDFLFIAGVIIVSVSLLILVLGSIYGLSELLFLLTFFGGALIFFSGTYLEGKYEDTQGSEYLIKHRRVKMRVSILGGVISIFGALFSIIMN